MRAGTSSRLALAAVAFAAIGLALVTGLVRVQDAEAATVRNARLYYVGPSGLEEFNAWTQRARTLVPGMTGGAGEVYLSPDGRCVVTAVNGRADRAWQGDYQIARVAARRFFRAVPEDSGMTAFEGWSNNLTGVFNDYNGNYHSVSATSGAWTAVPESTRVTRPSQLVTGYDRVYAVSQRSGYLTVKYRRTGKTVSRFRMPRPSSRWALDSTPRFSPDGRWMAYEVLLMDAENIRPADYRTYVVRTDGRLYRRMRGSWTGLTWAK